jgi:hypothetical protein
MYTIVNHEHFLSFLSGASMSSKKTVWPARIFLLLAIVSFFYWGVLGVVSFVGMTIWTIYIVGLLSIFYEIINGIKSRIYKSIGWFVLLFGVLSTGYVISVIVQGVEIPIAELIWNISLLSIVLYTFESLMKFVNKSFADIFSILKN